MPVVLGVKCDQMMVIYQVIVLFLNQVRVVEFSELGKQLAYSKEVLKNPALICPLHGMVKLPDFVFCGIV